MIMETVLFIILSCLVVLAGAFEAGTDILAFKYEWSVFKLFNKPQFFDEQIAYKNKYKSKYKFVRYLMSTIFVMFTSAWHLFKALHSFCLFGIVMINHVLFEDTYVFMLMLLLSIFVKKIIFEISTRLFIIN